MHVSADNWWLHCLVPHSGHDVSEQVHSMLSDQRFWLVMVWVMVGFMLLFLAIWLTVSSAKLDIKTDFRPIFYEMPVQPIA